MKSRNNIVGSELSTCRTLSLETSQKVLTFIEDEGGGDQGGVYLDTRNLNLAAFTGATITGFAYSRDKDPETGKPSYVNDDYGYAEWELYLIETSNGPLKIWFYCTDGGHCHGGANVVLQKK